jgi:phospholipid-translocating ATPase
MPPRDTGPPLRLNTSSAGTDTQEPVGIPETVGSPRRARGYSLRTPLFNRNIGQRNESPIELVNGPLQDARTSQPLESSKVSFSVDSEVYENDEENQNWHGQDASETRQEDDNKKKSVGLSRSSDLLPNYATIAARSLAKDQLRKKLKQSTSVLMDFVLRKKHAPPSKGGRRMPVEVVDDRLIIDERTDKPHIKNNITSSIYTVYNFFPRQLIYQFSKIANVYVIDGR